MLSVQRYMIHLKNSSYAPRDAQKLLTESRKLTSEIESVIRDTRVSSKYLEFDVSVDKEKLSTFVTKLNTIGPLDHTRLVIEEQIEKNEAIEQGRFYFNNERYWECHEVIEGVWKQCFQEEKELLNGIILIAAAMVHFQKDENTICFSILKRALEKLANSDKKYHGIDVDTLRKTVSQMIETGKIKTLTI